MKFALNGALTIGTLDGANIEIRDAVGAENFFLFGLTADEVAQRRPEHHPWETYLSNAAVRRALDAIAGGEFCPDTPTLFQPILEWLTGERDHYMLMADIESYVQAQERADALWKQPSAWDRAAILNIARIGYFSADRAVREYAERIWHVSPTPIELPSAEALIPPPASKPKPARVARPVAAKSEKAAAARSGKSARK
jgi:starch phosphorylase